MGPRADREERLLKAAIAETESLRQEGFMQCENEWRKTLGFSDLGETKHYVDVCRAYFLKLHGNPYPPSIK